MSLRKWHDIFQSVVVSNKLIRGFGFGPELEVTNWEGDGNVNYPYCYLNAPAPDNRENGVVWYPTSFYILARDLESRVNLVDRLAECEAIGRSVLDALRLYYVEQPEGEVIAYDANDFGCSWLIEEFADRTIGVRFEGRIGLHVPQWRCDLPYEGFVPVPPYPRVPPFSPGLTCETISQCPVIQTLTAQQVAFAEALAALGIIVTAQGETIEVLADEIDELQARKFVSQLSVTVREFEEAPGFFFPVVSWTSLYDLASGAVFQLYRWNGVSFLPLGGFGADGRETEYTVIDFFLDPIPSEVVEYVLTVTTLADPTEVRVSAIEWDFALNNALPTVAQNTTDIAALMAAKMGYAAKNIFFGVGLRYTNGAHHAAVNFNISANTQYYIPFIHGTGIDLLDLLLKVGFIRTMTGTLDGTVAIYDAIQLTGVPTTLRAQDEITSGGQGFWELTTSQLLIPGTMYVAALWTSQATGVRGATVGSGAGLVLPNNVTQPFGFYSIAANYAPETFASNPAVGAVKTSGTLPLVACGF